MSNATHYVVEQLVKDLKSRPDDFGISQNQCRLIDHHTRVQYWIGNGRCYFRVCVPEPLYLSWWEKGRAWRAFKQWQKTVAYQSETEKEIVACLAKRSRSHLITRLTNG